MLRAPVGAGATATEVPPLVAIGVELLDAAAGTAGVSVPVDHRTAGGVDHPPEFLALTEAERAHATTVARVPASMGCVAANRRTIPPVAADSGRGASRE